MVVAEHGICCESLEYLVAESLADVEGVYIELVVTAKFTLPVGSGPVASPSVRLAVDGRGGKSRLLGVDGEGSSYLSGGHLVLSVVADYALDSEIVGNRKLIVESQVDTLVIVVAPFEVGVVIHVSEREAIGVLAAAGHRKLMIGAPTVTPHHILPVGVKECHVIDITHVEGVAVYPLVAVFLGQSGVFVPCVVSRILGSESHVVVVHKAHDDTRAPLVKTHYFRAQTDTLVCI